jgi:hypothetical protein
MAGGESTSSSDGSMLYGFPLAFTSENTIAMQTPRSTKRRIDIAETVIVVSIVRTESENKLFVID